MFKFDFDIDDLDDLEETLPSSKIQPLPSDKPQLKLEPFAEILIDHLVRGQLLSNLPPTTKWHTS
jgi:hypothetical protein